MDAKSAVKVAKSYIADLFQSEGVANIGLEELFFDERHNQWQITIGFSRKLDEIPAPKGIKPLRNPRRTYRIVTVDDGGHPVSVKHREVADAS